MNRLEGKVALVAGGSKGIGYAISTTFAREGAAVAVVGSGLTAAQKTAQEILDFGGRAIAIGTDLTSGEGREAALEQTLNAFGKLDIIVNNAGWGCKKPLVETDEVSFDRSIALNLKATYFMTQIAAKQMIQQGHGGRIINISSTRRPAGGAELQHLCCHQGRNHGSLQSRSS